MSYEKQPLAPKAGVITVPDFGKAPCGLQGSFTHWVSSILTAALGVSPSFIASWAKAQRGKWLVQEFKAKASDSQVRALPTSPWAHSPVGNRVEK